MNRAKDTNNQKLNDLLNKNSQADNSFDNFDKEALEGFSMLKNEAEAFELKVELDKDVYTKVITTQKNDNKKNYWLAAAGLFLVVGFSIYVLKNNSIETKHDIAINQPTRTVGTKPKQIVTLKQETDKQESLSTPVIPSRKHSLTSQNVIPTIKAIEDVAVAKTNNNKITALSADDAMESTVVASQPMAATEKILKKPTIENDEESDLVIHENKFEINNGSVALAEQEAAVSSKSKKRISENQYAAKTNPVANTCFYTGGDDSLRKDLKEKLTEKSIDKTFEAILFINKNKTVDKVEFINASKLNRQEQKQLIEILKTLNKFDFKSNPITEILSEYRLVYNP